ncbi:TonB-dependent receptor [Curvibacter sp. RS43]|uniref:TonB-dependent receptor n=1 Tax=Curvibacter microcysteis TaxID=3026419 RepID=UPI00235ED280|nr:TonB-dependent receptor [Curvibacter sp. RS43]MDD0809851.1 TonB-dependent receptor [Curvibacter sp. RS43]
MACLAGAVAGFSHPVQAQEASPPAATAAASGPSLREVTVTGNPLGATDLIVPVSTLQGAELAQQARGTLGETLNGTPGVSSTYFGPNASRPIIRGLDGDRIRVLNNGGATLDASALSFDHAVPLEPITVDRIEVLRGPGALQYGGSAVGGVVNVIDNRIPREALNGVTGKVDLGGATGNGERSSAAMVEGGNERYALHVDGFDRRTDDVKVPLSLACERAGSPAQASRICNSASRAQGGALGGSVFFDRGYLGASVATYQTTYGTVAEDNVSIGMRSNRYALEGEWRQPVALLENLKFQFSHSDYRHTEYESGVAGTRFSNQGNDLRLEARHQPWSGVQGVVGFQAESGRFAAVGDEAFAPYSRSSSQALFVHEELPTAWGKLSAGARTEQVTVRSLGNAEVDRFQVGERRFNPHSLALGALWNVAPAWLLTSNLAYTERAPKDYELFANGPHLATAAWETGNSALSKERSTSLELGAQWKSGPHQAALNAYQTRFANYIGLLPSGDVLSAEGQRNPSDASVSTYPEYRYVGIRARFTGLEGRATVRLQGPGGLRPVSHWGTLDLQLRGDLVRAINADTQEALPRIAPARLGASLAWSLGPWSLRGGFDHAAAQSRVPSDSRATAAYTLWNAMGSYKTTAQWGGQRTQLLWYARLDNLTNQLAYSATSILTTTAFPKAPLPGRSLKVGLQLAF